MAGLGSSVWAEADAQVGPASASTGAGATAAYGPPRGGGSGHPFHPRNFPGLWLSVAGVAALVLIRWSLPR